jgi:hypothetical protein
MNKKISVFALVLIASVASYAQTNYSFIPYRSGDKWGYATTDKKVVINPAYSEVGWFNYGYAPVKVGNKWGYINETGKLVIPAKYTVAKPFRKGYMPDAKGGGDSVLFAGASIQANGYEICINTKGARMPKCPAIPENSVAENRIPVATVVREKTYTLPNNNGLFDKIVDDYKIQGSDETYYVAVKNNQYGIFNSKLEPILPFEYNSIRIIPNSAAPYLEVGRSGMYGIVNGSGQVVINPDYSKLSTIRTRDGKDLVIVQKGGRTYVKDINNNDIISQGYADIVYDDQGGFIVTGDDQMRGYQFMDNRSIAPKYKEIHVVEGNSSYLMVKTNSGKWGYISDKGDEYFIE